MKRYYIALSILTLLLLAASIAVRLFDAPQFHLFMPLLAVYFGVVAGVQHFVVVKSMKKSPRQFVQYFMGATVATLLLHLVSFMVMWFAPQAFIVAMPLMVLYFAAVTTLQHTIVVKAMQRSPRTFVQLFLGTTIGVLFLHLIVITVYILSCFATWRPFLFAFAVCFVVYTAFETVALVKYIDNEKKRRQD